MKKLIILFAILFAYSQSVMAAGFISDRWDFKNDSSQLVIEGSTDDTSELTISITDPTADRTLTIPNQTGSITLFANANTQDVNLIFEGATADGFETTFTFTDPTADRTVTVGDATGNVAVDTSGATAGNVLLETEIDASAELLALIDDETGTGLLVFATSPTLTTPVIGAATGTSLAVTGDITSSDATDLGWSVVSGANAACNTTCTSACVMGVDTAASSFLACTDATADVCLCAGAS